MADAIIGYGAAFSVETGPGTGVFTELAEVVDITPPNLAVDDVEVTHMKSPGRVKEYIAGLTDAGEMQVTLNYIPTSATDAFILAWRAAGNTRACRITYPNNVAFDTFPGYAKGYAPSLAAGDKAQATLTVKVAGAVVRT
jgi:predicted secreted protein